jgi:hypothetical protein
VLRPGTYFPRNPSEDLPMTTPETPVPAAPKRIPFVTDAIRLARVLFSPGAVFEEQREKPTVWIPWLLLSVMMVAVTLVNLPVTRQAMRLAAEARGQPMPAAAESIALVSTVVMTPIILLVMILVSAGIMYLVLLATGGEVRFKGLMCAATFATIVGMLQLVLMAIVLKLRGPEGIRTVADMQVSFGLDLLLPADTSLPKFVEGLLAGVSPFSLWSLALMAFGVQAVEKQTKGAAWSAAAGSFLVTLVVGAFFASLGGAR